MQYSTVLSKYAAVGLFEAAVSNEDNDAAQ